MIFLWVYLMVGGMLAALLVLVAEEEAIEGKARQPLFWLIVCLVMLCWPAVLLWIMTAENLRGRS